MYIYGCEEHQEAIIAGTEEELDRLVAEHYRTEPHDDPA